MFETEYVKEEGVSIKKHDRVYAKETGYATNIFKEGYMFLGFATRHSPKKDKNVVTSYTDKGSSESGSDKYRHKLSIQDMSKQMQNFGCKPGEKRDQKGRTKTTEEALQDLNNEVKKMFTEIEKHKRSLNYYLNFDLMIFYLFLMKIMETMKFVKEKGITFEVGQYVYLNIDTGGMTNKENKCEHCGHKNQVFGVCARKSPLRTKYVRVSVP